MCNMRTCTHTREWNAPLLAFAPLEGDLCRNPQDLREDVVERLFVAQSFAARCGARTVDDGHPANALEGWPGAFVPPVGTCRRWNVGWKVRADGKFDGRFDRVIRQVFDGMLDGSFHGMLDGTFD